MKLFKRIYDKYFGPGTTFYTILKPCRRCVYQKSYEPILIFSFNRGPRILIVENKAYLRSGDCLGFRNCGKCLEAKENMKDFPCKWLPL